MKFKPWTLTWLIFGISCAMAQVPTPEAPAEAVDALRRYTVEMIVFEYADSSMAGNETFVVEAVDPPPGDLAEGELVFTDLPATVESSNTAGKPSIAEIPQSRLIDLRLLEPERYTMRDIYRKLQTLGAYKPIMHTAWTQTTVEKDMTPPIKLRMLGNAPLRLDGQLTLYLSRYLHLVVDLALDAGPSAQTTVGDAVPDTGEMTGDIYVYSDKPELQPAVLRYRIFDDRIFKSGDVRYFDHPKFGVLVKVTRDESTNPDPGAEPAGSTLTGTGSP